MRAMALLALMPFLLTGSLAPEVASPDPTGPDPTSMALGPYAGVLEEGQSDAHHYQNAPDGVMCVQIVQPYTVHLVHAPTDAAVELRVGTHATVSSDGVAMLHFEAGVCAAFKVQVQALDAATPVAYAAHVQAGPAAAPGPGGALA